MHEDVNEISNLLERYCWTVDRGRWKEWLECFEPDCHFVMGGQELTGREEIRAYVEDQIGSFRLIRHFLCHPRIAVDGDSTAQCRSYWRMLAVTGYGNDVEGFGSYEDKVVRGADGSWRFAERIATIDFLARRGTPWSKLRS